MTGWRDSDAAKWVGQVPSGPQDHLLSPMEALPPGLPGTPAHLSTTLPQGLTNRTGQRPLQFAKTARNGTFKNLERTLSHSGQSTPDRADTTTPTPRPYDLSFCPFGRSSRPGRANTQMQALAVGVSAGRSREGGLPARAGLGNQHNHPADDTRVQACLREVLNRRRSGS